MSAPASESPEPTLLGHPRGLFVLFFAEMWERFSYFGMRALLMVYMLNHLMYSKAEAGDIYGDYAGLVYLTPLLGGFIADRFLGLRRSIVLGGLLLAAGHGIMTIDDRWHENQWFMMSALLVLIVGNGFFKPNISTLVGKLYAPGDGRRDAGFTIFYIGVNVGAFLAPITCGWIGQKSWGDVKDGMLGVLEPVFRFILRVDTMRDDQPLWHVGFGLAMIGMLIGLLVFSWGARAYLGQHGLAPSETPASDRQTTEPISGRELGIIGGIVAIGLGLAFWTAHDATSGTPGRTAPPTAEELAKVRDEAVTKCLLAAEAKSDIPDLFQRAEHVIEGRVSGVAPSVIGERSALDVTVQVERVFKSPDAALTVLTFRMPTEIALHKKDAVEILVQDAAAARLGQDMRVLAFVSPDLAGAGRAIVGLRGQGVFNVLDVDGRTALERDAAMRDPAVKVRRQAGRLVLDLPDGKSAEDGRGILEGKYHFAAGVERFDRAEFVKRLELAAKRAIRVPPKALTFIRSMLWPIAGTLVFAIFALLMLRCRQDERTRVGSIFTLGLFVMLFWGAFEQAGSSLTIFADENTRLEIFGWAFESSMFQSVNPFCIIIFGPLFSALWTWLAIKGIEPPTPFKMFLGLAFECVGFLLLIGPATEAHEGGIKVSALWLTASYTLQTLGELCLSPVGLSMVTKLAPARFGAMLMGVWFLANAFANKLAGVGAATLEKKSPSQLFTFITLTLAVGAGVLLFVIPLLRRWMKGVR